MPEELVNPFYDSSTARAFMLNSGSVLAPSGQPFFPQNGDVVVIREKDPAETTHYIQFSTGTTVTPKKGSIAFEFGERPVIETILPHEGLDVALQPVFARAAKTAGGKEVWSGTKNIRNPIAPFFEGVARSIPAFRDSYPH